ncbi:hypothetical protein [Halogeometricum limi]|uniref:Uncharacterized protein n=1 Tax=Halogeometricum limi TaxID=555875 RepID=A0A1I6G2P2_9EURY|nr:hypothetical protein [Halogeometricum limi]SFR36337.1 hypothetical protein SAMN04488124_0756 [Halogeometricum limi]
MADDSADDGPVRIPIEDDPVEDESDGSRSIGLVMLALAGVAAAVIYVASRGDDTDLEPPF